jgi:metal-dependent hydrolase (beta-lactamase superfamily II)
MTIRAAGALVAEDGFSVLVAITKAGREGSFLLDADTSQDRVVENMRRLGSPA